MCNGLSGIQRPDPTVRVTILIVVGRVFCLLFLNVNQKPQARATFCDA